MSEEVEVITLEDNKEYIVTDEIIINNVKYVYLTNENDIANFCIRKVNNINNTEFLVGLDSKEEVIIALKEFKNKFKTE